jgi:hypothetical protein
MAALDLATIPSNINTYERLLVWAAQCVADIASPKEIQPVLNEPSVPQASVATAVIATGENMFIIGAYVPFDPGELNSPSEKTWMAAVDINNTDPHLNLRSN